MEQYQSIFFNIASASSNEFSFRINDGIDLGNIIISTNEDFNGTTSSVQVRGSNDGQNFVFIYSFTLTTDNSYVWYIDPIFFAHYKLVYSPGDATLGSLSANFFGKNG